MLTLDERIAALTGAEAKMTPEEWETDGGAIIEESGNTEEDIAETIGANRKHNAAGIVALRNSAVPIIAELRAELATWHDIHGTENASEVAEALRCVRLQRDEARAERDRLAERCKYLEHYTPKDILPMVEEAIRTGALAEKGTTDGN